MLNGGCKHEIKSWMCFAPISFNEFKDGKMNQKKEFTPNISGTDKSVTGSGLEGWLALIGFVANFVTIYIARGTELVVVKVRNGSLVGDLVIWPFVIFCLTALLILLVEIFFCAKDSEGNYEYKDKHMWVRPLIRVLLGLLFIGLGWLIGISCYSAMVLL